MSDTTSWEWVDGYDNTTYSDDSIFTVDGKTKKIQNITDQTLVAGEDRSQLIMFELDRYYDAIDLSEKHLQIIFQAENGYTDINSAVCVKRSADRLRFGWVVPGEALTEPGTLAFSVEAVGSNYVWKTRTYEKTIEDGLNGEIIIPEPTERAWYIEIQSQVATAVENAEAALAKAKAIINGIGSPTTAATAAAMTDTTKVYVYTGSETGYTYGDWYYYDGTEWVSGGEYVSTALYTDSTPTQGSNNAVSSGGVYDALAEINAEIAPLEVTVNELDKTVNGSSGGAEDISDSVDWVSGGGVIYYSGEINHNATNYSHADIPLSGATHVSGYTRAGQETSKGLCFLDSNGNWLYGEYNAGATTYDWNYTIDVPDGAVTLRICCATSRIADFTCFITTNASEGLLTKVTRLESKDLADLASLDINNPTDGQTLKYDAQTQKWINADSTDETADIVGENVDYYWVDGYYIDKDSPKANEGKYTANANKSLSIADIHAFAGGKIKGHTRLAGNAVIAFYDSNDIYISAHQLPSGASYDYDYDIDVPVNAKIVKLSCGTSYKSTFTISGYGLIHGVNNSAHTGALEYDCPSDVYGLDSVKSDFHYDSATRLADMYKWFDILASTFPRNITKVQIGTSTTPEGTYATIDSNTYPIYAYIIQGDSYISGNDFIIASGIHGDESVGDGIQSVVSVAYFIRDMLANPAKSKYLAFMKWNCRILVIPVMNPWGYQNGKRCNGRGVDCNRNFDLNFVPDDMSYGYSSGASAFSENESSAVATYISENFTSAKYCTELHTRGGNTLPSDDRWYTTTTSTAIAMQDAVTSVGYYLRRLYGGSVANGQQNADSLPPTFRAYTDHVIGIPAHLIECAKSVNMDITTFNSDLVQRQYVQYLGSMTQKLVETFVM